MFLLQKEKKLEQTEKTYNIFNGMYGICFYI